MAGARAMILDTCALLWLAQGGGKLSASALKRIQCEPVVYVCAISGFEIGSKQRKGKLTLPATLETWFAAIIDHHDLSVLPLSLEACIRAVELPQIHNDPCDRMIIAAALVGRHPVVTHDAVFGEYGIDLVM
jgi:PIN domain nuclease of toxin-antitoxin system